MGLFGKKDKKSQKESRATRWFRILLWRLFVRWKVRERIAIANKWAENNRGAFLTLGKESDSSDNFLYGVEPVESIFQGMQQIQNAKAYQISQLQQMAQRGQLLKHELDSLVQLPDKSHEDSMQIIIKYKQLELIVNNLEKGQ